MVTYYSAAILALAHTRSRTALKPLQKYLRLQEARRKQWRNIREDEDTSAFKQEQTDEHKEQMKNWRKRLQAVAPQTYLEFNLGYAIAQIDPQKVGLDLLSHDLANVRQGAWLGLAKLPLATKRPFKLQDGADAVIFLERLYNERRASKHPLFRHAAYRAIDEMLVTIAAYGDPTTQAVLEVFLKKDMDPAVQTRVAWTIARLNEHGKE